MPPSPCAGVVAASLTPFAASGAVDHAALVDHLHWLRAHGCDGVLLFGTTGEGLSLSSDERLQALSAVLDAGIAPDRLLIGTGASALPDVVHMTRHATEAGVAGVLVVPPFHFRDIPSEGLFRFYDQLVQQVGSDALRLYFYHYPELSGVPIPFPVIQELHEAYGTQIAGIKDSSGEWDHTEALIRRFPDVRVFAGTERLLLPTLRAGGAGCISATVNVTAPMAQRVYTAWRNGASADAPQQTLTELRGAFVGLPTIAALKQLCGWRDETPMNASMRPPLVRLTAAERNTLRDVAGRIQEAIAS